MEKVLTGGVGVLLAWFAEFALPLSVFIRAIEEETLCRKCTQLTDCFARRKTKQGDFLYVEKWMLISFFQVRKKCPYIRRNTLRNIIISFMGCLGVYLFPLWSGEMGIRGFLYGIAAAMLFFLSIVDWQTQYIPLECNVIIFLCGLIHLFADFSNWVDYLIGLFAVSGFLLFVDRIFTPVLREKYQGEAEIEHVIGDGDIKLMAATGLLLGWQLNFLALGIGCVAGSVIHLILMKIRKADRQFAFGPYLSLGVYITMICGEQLISWYLNMLGIKPT